MEINGHGIRIQDIGHAPVCSALEVHPESGLGWKDMPGTDSDNKKLNFFFHRRGIELPKSPFGYRTPQGGKPTSSRRQALGR